MCFIISIIGLILGFNFFMAQSYIAAFISVLVSGFFIFLMIKNIKDVKKIRGKRKNDS